MALTERTEHMVEVLPDGQLQVREALIIEREGVEVSRTYHRHVVDVGDDVADQADLVKEIAAAVHTPQRVAARAQAKANENAPI